MLDLCKNPTAHKAHAELERTLTWPNFPTIDQVEALVRFANENGDTEMRFESWKLTVASGRPRAH